MLIDYLLLERDLHPLKQNRSRVRLARFGGHKRTSLQACLISIAYCL